ncbi:threonine-phosphate decarboxylase [Rhodovibrio salinarum]|uniref:threonine-phosphate decarboxylase n=1 Tax=Rhodovibrio salinarum TaxID=1087 RepID=A0A934QEB8_9PROT|nr:threonine-phosphate decarboxylase [Rhodovibrio salinarum]
MAHGGNLATARARYGIPADGWIDLSTGINPHAYPLPDLPQALWTALPQADNTTALTEAAARAYGVPNPATLVPAPGTQALIQRLPRILGSDHAAVIGPTYGEYTPAWKAAGAVVTEASEIDAALDALSGAARPALILCNPNNPDGRTTDPARLIALADRLATAGGTLVVDEAFADVAPDISVGPWGSRPGLVVLRSFGKFFGLAGVRLGFAVCPPALAHEMSCDLGPWAVSGPALAVGRTALADDAWQTAMRVRLSQEAERLQTLLSQAGFKVVGGTPLYVLVQSVEAPAWHDRLARAGIWVRAFPERSELLRFGLPADRDGWHRLSATLGVSLPATAG